MLKMRLPLHLVQLLGLPAAVLLADQPQQQERLRVPAPPPPPPVRRAPRLRLRMPRRLLLAEALLHGLRRRHVTELVLRLRPRLPRPMLRAPAA